MIAPKGWTEPFVKCEFEIQGMVLNGKLGLETEKGILIISEKEGFLIPKNTKVRIHNAGDSELRIIEILRPAYKKSLVTKYPLGK
jgi:mannose-6-phosphate isomerase-like protein (cupin superfamily)